MLHVAHREPKLIVGLEDHHHSADKGRERVSCVSPSADARDGTPRTPALIFTN